jgi:hypothetical protein
MEPEPTRSSPPLRRIVAALARHPDVWLEATRLAVAASPPGWWRRPPFLPVPDPAYLHWRAVTAYGGTGELPEDLDEMVDYLRWRRRHRL